MCARIWARSPSSMIRWFVKAWWVAEKPAKAALPTVEQSGRNAGRRGRPYGPLCGVALSKLVCQSLPERLRHQLSGPGKRPAHSRRYMRGSNGGFAPIAFDRGRGTRYATGRNSGANFADAGVNTG